MHHAFVPGAHSLWLFLVLVLLAVFLVWLGWRLLEHQDQTMGSAASSSRSTGAMMPEAEEILRLRLARGEIDEAAFKSLLATLRGSAIPPSA